MSQHFKTDLSKYKYPGIARVTLEMAYRNGGVNRDRSEGQVLKAMDTVISNTVDEAWNILVVDGWLSGLNDEALSIVADGEETEAKEVLAFAPPGTYELLGEIFDNVV